MKIARASEPSSAEASREAVPAPVARAGEDPAALRNPSLPEPGRSAAPVAGTARALERPAGRAGQGARSFDAGAYLAGHFAAEHGRDMVAAARYLRAASDSAPREVEVALEALRAAVIAGDMRSAVTLARRLPDDDARKAPLLDAAELLGAGGGDGAARRELAQVYRDAARTALRQEQAMDAVFFARLAAFYEPATSSTLATARALAEVGQAELAIAELARVAKGSRGYAEARLELARLHLDGGAPAEAAIILQQLPPSDPRDRVLARALVATGRLDEASQALSRLLVEAERRGQPRADLLAERASVQQALGRTRAAEADLVEATRLEPRNAPAALALARVWLARGERVPEAERVLAGAAARLSEELERLSPAQREARAAGLLEQQRAVLADLGHAQAELGRYDDALGSLQGALASGRTSWATLERLGDVYSALGRHVEAGWAFGRAHDAADADARERLAGKLAAASSRRPL